MPNGRYDEARGRRESAHQGVTRGSSNRFQYWVGTEFVDGARYRTERYHRCGQLKYDEEI
ncbi:Atu4866 domain-containing protein [Methylocella tundrae]|uniref:Atu4866 domain-containing protein n=1 Tax=Methylocella tundrae TaxID=227605 RepID=UPI00106A6BAC|nr:Atu4866 domain-containing protein [Methylocella tundrae]WPP05915.1 Atu4866 domain-containing protein [Methylocella tundrae]